MKKFRIIKSKIIMFIFALILPLSASGLVYTLNDMNTAKADDGTSTSTNYYSGYMKEVSVTNNNFNSSSSTYSISTSLSGWTGQLNDRNTTAGIINTGNSFQTYMTSTYHLSNNPLAKATDKYILMINSQTSDSTKYATARQGYKSNTISLSANSFYSFQVSYKNDTNYNSYTSYVVFSNLEEQTTIGKSIFEAKGFDEYISFTYKSKTYYLHKTLSEAGQLANAVENAKVFYEDDKYIGFMNDNAPVYVSVNDIEKVGEGDQQQININNGATYYTCDIAYDSEKGNYVVAEGTTYYTTKTDYDSLNDYVFGSMYLSGLTDEDGNPVKAEYVRVSSKEWVTFYFFVATGNKEQSVTLDLWLGANESGKESSGVVFFDDCHVYQYSENTFWKTYQSYFGKTYTQEITGSDGNVTTEVYDCVNLIDLRNKETIDYPTNNFDFEDGIYNDDISSLKNWKKSGSGNAQIFDSKSPEYFKSVTGYDFVGSNLSCEAEIDGEKVSISANNYLLGLWADNNYVNVKSNDVSINANEIYKIKAYYKISELTDGNVYMFVEENDNVLTAYNLTDKQYTLTAQTASSAVTANADNDFVNDYGVIEFYVKGGALYNSSINISLGLGKSDESATGCVVFDDVTVEKATSEEYDAATNKVQLNTNSATLTVPNGNFNLVTIDNYNYPLTAQNWTVEGGNGLLFDGVINTEESEYKKYVAKYNELKASGVEDIDNPYYWATYTNPKNSRNSTTEPDNVMMLANIHESWQKLTSENISLEANSTYKLSFKYKTYSTTAQNASINISLYGEDGFKLFEANDVSSNGEWKEYSIYLKSLEGTNNAYIVIDFGTTENNVAGFAYFDNFELTTVESKEYENKVNTAEGNEDTFGVVDMSNFYLNLPTNDITTDLNTSITPAYTGSVSSSDGSAINGGIVKSDKFTENSPFYIEKETADEESKNVFFIQSQGVGSYTIQSNFNLDLKADTYYALSFKLKTNFNYNNNGVELDKNKTYSYGATFGITGFDYMTSLVSNDGYETYTMYFHPTEDASGKLYIALVCDTTETAGSMAIYDIAFEESDETTYNSANDTATDKNYDVNEDKVFVSKADSTEGDTDEGTDDTEEPTTDTTEGGFDWLLIPSLITALAIVIAVVGSILRKVKIKKIERKRKETYDRKSSLNVDAVKTKAKKQRDAEILEVKSTIDKFQKELDNLEKLHKQKVLSLREKDKGQVSKETDKEFKVFAQKRTVIVEKIDSLNKQIENINSPEYLLSLERKVYAQEEMKQKELAKLSKRLNKEQAKTNNKTEENNSKTSNNNKRK